MRCRSMRPPIASLVAVLGLAAIGACAREDAPSPTPSGAAMPAAAPVTPAPAAPVKVAPPRPAQLRRVTIKALGMYCEESCPVKVRYALAEITSIYELGFDLSNESIFISYDAALGAPKDVTKPMLAAIKERAGFDPWLAKETWPADAAAAVQVVMRESRPRAAR